ncbi:amino acid adenylation domain-containing protein [Candidatus Parabeggiatoa sp. HSG14]|uniref:amino acid adenylation domain-containing protein n=1 Tax=Candidatus Parabeggiatoa sp. HSG14 TaxID=3055593 RepID=UPI0025A6B3DA|nr:amino acid adenylation domain-containing protein [Thiotrichales bacterium HSG14]
MKTIKKLLSELKKRNIKLWLENNQLRYKAPKGALTTDLRAQLVKHKADIIQFLADTQLDSEDELPPIVSVSRNEKLPLSFAQQRLWFLNQLEGQNATYNMSAAECLVGSLHIPALKQSLLEIVQRHEILQTIFPTINGEPSVQLSTIHYQLPIINLQEIPLEAQAIEIQRLTNEESQHPFDLSKGPLFRTTLLRVNQNSHILLVNMHHIISDGWSISVFIRELVTLYEAFSKDEPSPLPPLTIQYVDFAHWQRQWLAGERLQTQIDYWQQQLADIPARLELPTDYPRPPVQTFKGHTQSFEIQKELLTQLNQLSQENNATLFMTLLAVYAVLLGRYSSTEDIVIGSPIANRHFADIEPLIGFFINTLVLRTNLSGNPCFNDLLVQVKKACLDAYAHQDVPLEQLVETLKPERNLSHTPLFQVMFVLQNTPEENLALPDLTLTPLELDNITAKFDLTLSLEETTQGISGSLEYNTDLFNADTIRRMVTHFETLLKGIIAAPTQPISQLPLLTETEKHQILIEWNNTEKTYPQNQCLHQLFETQVEQTPNAIAVTFENQQLTYQTLNKKANQLAHYLQSLGVKPEVLVGICIERSLEMVIGLLGILKAGGAYVPLDPNYPQERLAFMLKDSQILILLTQEKLIEKLSGLTQNLKSKAKNHLVCLDSGWKTISQLNDNNPSSGAMPSNLAYMIYTSGSTGQPKGVMNTHRGICNRLLWMQEAYQLNHLDKILQKTPFSFDVSVWEFFWPLLAGACLVVAKPNGHKDNAYLIKIIIVQKITTLHFVPSMLQVMVQEPEFEKCTSLKRVICSGEALPFELQERFFARLTHQVELHNLYGPTEAAVDVTYWQCQRESHLKKVPIGYPIANIQLYILDSYQEPTSIGIPGELHISGIGLARGYFNRVELTAEKFIPNPFSKESNARLYKTGDLARYLPDGSIEYLNRIDNQVKIRGFRIELGEIETILLQHALVQEAIVLSHNDSENNNYLVAYLVPNADQNFSINELRQFLKEKLPDYMIPANFVVLENIPLTAHGKVDYRALPKPEATRATDTVFKAPRTSEEEILANIWAEVLNLEQVGIHDNFFDLGGDSIRSIKIIAKAKQANLDFSLQQLFQMPTIYELAHLIEQESSLIIAPQTTAFSLISDEERLKLSDDVEDAYPLSALQGGMLFHSEYSPETGIYHDVFSYYLKTPFNHQALYQAIQKMAEGHPMLRSCFAFTNVKVPLQFVHKQVEIPLQVDDLRHLPEIEQKTTLTAWINAEKNRPFNWEEPPLLRFHIYRRSEETFNLTLSFHHAIFDGWSVASLMTQLFQHYLSQLGREISIQPIPATTFCDFIALEKLTLESKTCRQYWLDRLNDYTLLKLPRWPKAYWSSQKEQGELEVPISIDVSNGLKQLAKKAHTPIKSVLLAAHLKVLSVMSNQADILTGLVSDGRLEEIGSENVLGLFLNTLPFRLALQEGSTWIDLVEETFKLERNILPHRRFPLADIQRMLGGQTLFETAFNFIHFHIYQNILAFEEVESLGGEMFEQTNFTLLTNFSLELDSQKINLELAYDTNKLCEEQVKAIAHYYTETFTAMIDDPFARYENHSLLSDKEQQKLLIEWNNTATDYPKERCIHQLFEAQVARTPDAIAVEFEGQSLSYAALNQKANQLAHYLQSVAVKPDTIVGICIERSIEMMIGLLGILKAGGACLPLDPTYPIARLTMMLEDANVTVLLTQSSLIKQIPSQSKSLLCLDTEQFSSQFDACNPQSSVMPSHLAYVIYTSGSTGKPKGVAMEHAALVNLINWHQEHDILSHATRTLQFTSLNFDVSFQEIFTTWCTGGTIVLISENIRREPLALLSFLKERSIERLFLPFIALQQLAQVAEEIGKIPTQLSEVITAGEQLHISPAIAHFFSQLPHCTLHNHYGPSESHVVTTLTLSSIIKEWPSLPPIGRPIANTQIYLLDKFLNPVPVGVSGELYIGGICLARGYFNHPELTREKFIPNPFANNPNERLYKTGDLARYLPDGHIEYVSRLDNQVKIRGFRVELGEIEAQLAQHPFVQESIVIIHEISPNNKQLVAYLISNNSQSIDEGELRHFVKKNLPDYMIPSAFVQLEKMPLTPSGKIDRRSLEQLRVEKSLELTKKTFVAPNTLTEKLVAGLWAEVFDIEQVSIYDDFFELGGHSLLATQIILKIRHVFSIQLPLSQLFELSTVASLAEEIDRIRQAKTDNITIKKIALDLNNEVVLDSTIQPPAISIEALDKPRFILLTGATGFLGAYLLYELLQQTTAVIYCIVRSPSIEDAKKRLEKTLSSYSLWHENFHSRIIPIVGDLSQPFLGIPEQQFFQLAHQIDMIYHNGAWVNHLYPYSKLKAINVLGTQEVLRLACQTKAKPVHFISTIGVLFSLNIDDTILKESDFIDNSQLIDSGYVQSKWVAEKLVKCASDRGLPVCIYRPARIGGHSQTGISNTDDFFNLAIKSCIQLGKVPAIGEEEDNIMPVDYVSRAIIYLSLQNQELGKTFHLLSPHHFLWRDLFDWIRSFGYSLEEISYTQWLIELSSQKENTLYPYLSVFSQEEDDFSDEKHAQNIMSQFDCQNTIQGLANTNIFCPSIETQLLSIYFSYFWKNGFLDAPSK